jgi:SOS-response transcriptional repressor LexA
MTTTPTRQFHFPYSEAYMSNNIKQANGGAGHIEPRPANPEPSTSSWDRLSDAEIERQLALRGMTPASVDRSVHSILSRLREKHREQIQDEPISPHDGPPIEAIRFFEERVAAGSAQWNEGAARSRGLLPSDLFGKQNWSKVFTIKVVGNSMINDHISDGDVVLIDPTVEAKDGDIVLVFLAGEGQLIKRLRMIGDQLVLESSNPDFKPIAVHDLTGLSIQGVVRATAGQR